ncbi:MAG: hypothetical protein IKT46_05860 [Clostridia bacterium]|nr:hypothetical protein [Clostridia bacterium]
MLIILAAVILAVLAAVLLLCSYVRIYVSYEGELTAYVRLFGIFKLRLYPEKKPEMHMSSKKIKKVRKKVYKTVKKKEESKEKTDLKEIVTDLIDVIKELYELICIIIEKFSGKVKIHIKKLDVRVGTKDAAATALLYSGVCNGLDLLIDMLRGSDRVRSSFGYLNCSCDYLSEKSSADISILIKIRVYNFIFSALGIVKHIITKKLNSEE